MKRYKHVKDEINKEAAALLDHSGVHYTIWRKYRKSSLQSPIFISSDVMEAPKSCARIMQRLYTV